MSWNKRVRNNQKQDSQNLSEMKQLEIQSEIIRNKTVRNIIRNEKVRNNQKQNSQK